LRRSIQRELNDFFGRINNSNYSIKHVTKSTFTQACSKLKLEAFSELSSTVINTFYEGAPYLLWGNHRILACDGSTIMLPTSKDTAAVFKPEGFGPSASAERPVTKISLVYDVLNLVTLNAKI